MFTAGNGTAERCGCDREIHFDALFETSLGGDQKAVKGGVETPPAAPSFTSFVPPALGYERQEGRKNFRPRLLSKTS